MFLENIFITFFFFNFIIVFHNYQAVFKYSTYFYMLPKMLTKTFFDLLRKTNQFIVL